MDKIHVHARLTIKRREARGVQINRPKGRSDRSRRRHRHPKVDWYFNEDETVCIVREIYASSDAVLEHISHVEPLLVQLVELAEPQIEVFGRPSEALVKAGEAFNQVVFTPLVSL